MTRTEIGRTRALTAFLLTIAVAAAPACRKSPTALDAGIDVAGMDKSVAPGDDFNLYANGGWIKATPIPADKGSYGILSILADQTRTRTRTLIQEAAKGTPSGSGEAAKIGTYYATFMDEGAIESKG